MPDQDKTDQLSFLLDIAVEEVTEVAVTKAPAPIPTKTEPARFVEPWEKPRPPSRAARTTTVVSETAAVEVTAAPVEAKPKVEADWRTQVPTVSQITRRLRGQIENTFGDVWIRGEISNFRKPVSGHAYFILKDAGAQIRACFFRPAMMRVKFQLQDGMEVLLHGKLTVYEAKGDYQIIGDAIEPVGVGALQLAFEQLKQKLQKEGLFDHATKKKLPPLPRRIGVVTSSTGAAVQDILKVLSRRFPDREVMILPAAVQGERAAGEIVQAIKNAERWNREQPTRAIDVMIVGRGGGSLEDLWPFNEEIVARAIHACPIPIISAVGHEVDFTIADFVADLRAPTPSAAAEIVVPRKDELAFQVTALRQRLGRATQKKLEQFRLHLGHLAQRLVDPRQRVAQMKQTLAVMHQKLVLAMHGQLRLDRARWQGVVETLHALSPLAVIARGYSITCVDGESESHLARRLEDAPVGSEIRTRISDGYLVSEVRAHLPPKPKAE